MLLKRWAVLVPLLLCPASAARANGPERREPAQKIDADEPDRRFVFGLGGAFELDTAERSFQGGGNAFFEVEVIERWLEIEAGLSLIKGAHAVEMPIDLVFKKPFRLTTTVELMIGAGPELLYEHGTGRIFGGIEGVFDFMFWPTRHFGFWVEPAYDLVFRDHASLSFGGTAGTIVGL